MKPLEGNSVSILGLGASGMAAARLALAKSLHELGQKLGVASLAATAGALTFARSGNA